MVGRCGVRDAGQAGAGAQCQRFRALLAQNLLGGSEQGVAQVAVVITGFAHMLTM